MPDPAATSEFYARVQQQTAALLLSGRQLWGAVSPTGIRASWEGVRVPLAAQLAAGQIAAARAGADYVPAVLDELGMDPASTAAVRAQGFAVGTASGLPILDVLDSVPGRALGVAAQSGPQAGLSAGLHLLEGVIETHMADSARLASSVQMTASPAVQGYVRMVEPGACSRCIILAGRWYRWNRGFDRHVRCRCTHIPASEDVSGDFRTDPMAHFNTLSKAEQDRDFTAAGAQAIRDGADINQVVNARRGALGLTPAGARLTAAEKQALRSGNDFGHLQRTRLAGQDVLLTTEGTTRRGIAGKAMGNFEATRAPGQRHTHSARQRLMPESIYELATDRDDAIRLLRLYGYIF